MSASRRLLIQVTGGATGACTITAGAWSDKSVAVAQVGPILGRRRATTENDVGESPYFSGSRPEGRSVSLELQLKEATTHGLYVGAWSVPSQWRNRPAGDCTGRFMSFWGAPIAVGGYGQTRWIRGRWGAQGT